MSDAYDDEWEHAAANSYGSWLDALAAIRERRVSILQSHRTTGTAVDRENREKDDFYPTPPEATEALLRVEKFGPLIWEPACGDGAISKVLEAAGYAVISTDLVNRGFGESGVDFLMEYRSQAPDIVANPPFKMAAPFIRKSLDLTTGKIAMLLRLACLEGTERGEIFKASPLARVHVFSKRLTMARGRIATSEDQGGMIAFAWFVWEHGYTGKPTLGWL